MNAVAAQQSGCDMVMLCNNRAGAIQALDGLPQTQVPILNTLLKQPTPEFNVLMQTREWKQAQQTISGLVDKWNNKTN